MGVGNGAGKAVVPLDFESLSRKGCFLSFEREKTSFTTFGRPPEKFWKILWWPPWKNSSDAHVLNLNYLREQLQIVAT